MNNVFQKAVADIFNCKDFLEPVVIDGQMYHCIASAVNNENVYSNAGLIDEVDFSLSIQLPLPRQIKPDGKVSFRGVEYRVSRTEIDSAPASIRIYLRDLSRP